MRLLKCRTITNPRKQHECDLCVDAINGEHVYKVISDDWGLQVTRRHVACERIVCEYCTQCPYMLDCQGNPDECVTDVMRRDRWTHDDLRVDLRALRDAKPPMTVFEYLDKIELERS